MDKVVIGIDESYKRTGITVLRNKKIVSINSINFEGCKNNTEKRMQLTNELSNTLIKYVLDKNVEVTVILERIRLRSQGFISEPYIKATGALIATIIDFCVPLGVPVYSVDVRAWKSAIIGTTKPLENKYGINPNKYPTILYMRQKGLLKYIMEEYKGKGKKGVIRVNMGDRKHVPCTVNDDAADSYCIALYGFLPEKQQKLKEEKF